MLQLQDHETGSVMLSDSDIRLIAYIALRSKSIPIVYVGKQKMEAKRNRSVEIDFHPEKRGSSAQLTLYPLCKEADLLCSDEPGLDPFWNPTGMRMAELDAMFGQADYSLDVNDGYPTVDVNDAGVSELHTKYLAFKEEFGICIALRKTAEVTGLRALSEIRTVFENSGIAFERSTFYCQVGDYLHSGRTDTSDH